MILLCASLQSPRQRVQKRLSASVICAIEISASLGSGVQNPGVSIMCTSAVSPSSLEQPPEVLNLQWELLTADVYRSCVVLPVPAGRPQCSVHSPGLWFRRLRRQFCQPQPRGFASRIEPCVSGAGRRASSAAPTRLRRAGSELVTDAVSLDCDGPGAAAAAAAAADPQASRHRRRRTDEQSHATGRSPTTNGA